jgi:hypothetical protein
LRQWFALSSPREPDDFKRTFRARNSRAWFRHLGEDGHVGLTGQLFREILYKKPGRGSSIGQR